MIVPLTAKFAKLNPHRLSGIVSEQILPNQVLRYNWVLSILRPFTAVLAGNDTFLTENITRARLKKIHNSESKHVF